jgi:membrane-bound metal-dependent hydrolase YbcI (DUF457 family)
MDVLAHTLWTNALFHLKYRNQRRLRYLAAFFGVAPDLIGFTPLFIYLVLSGRMFSGERFPFEATNWTFQFASQAYNFTHSLVIFATVTLLVTLIGNTVKRIQNPTTYRFWFFWPILGWALHILIDIPTHPDFYSTPFLFPLSDFRNTHGVSWAHPVFMVVNYGVMILVYIGIFYYQRRKLPQTNES